MNERRKYTKELMESLPGIASQNEIPGLFKKSGSEGKANIAKLFKVASEAETLHALKEFGLAGKICSTADNIKDAIGGETHEYTEMYPAFLKAAEAEGNKAAATAFRFAMKAEEVHAKLYKEALENVDKDGEEEFYYLCPVCGNIEKYRPEKCSICGAPGDMFIKY